MRTAVLAIAVVSTLLPFAGILAVSAATPEGDDAAEVEQIIRDSIGWALTKDRARLESILSRDERLFMFNPTWDATVIGWDSFVPAFDFWMDPRFRATRFDVRDLRLTFSARGDVAWFSAILDDEGEWDGRPVEWRDTRWTGVLERGDDGWVIVQMHFSFARDKVIEEERDRLRRDECSEGGGSRRTPLRRAY